MQKYHNRKMKIENIVFDSQKEAQRYCELKLLEKKGEISLLLIRKKGKLPGETYSCAYSLEYGTAEIEAHKADIKKGANYLLVDDLIATGGTFKAGSEVIKQGGGNVIECFGIIGLPDLKFRESLAPLKVTTLIDYHGA